MHTEFLNENEKKVLELDSRRRIYEVVKTFAGCHFREIERKSTLPGGTVKYHLSYLTRQGLIKEERDGNNVRYFPRAIRTSNKKLLALLRQKAIRDIIICLLTTSPCNHEKIVQATNRAPSTISWHIKKLKIENIISIAKQGRKTFYSIKTDKSELIQLLITYQESFLDSLVDKVIEMWES